MSATRMLDVHAIPDEGIGRAAPIYLGMWGLIIVESTVFASLVSSYFYLHLMSTEWPPAGVKDPELLLPSLNTAILLGSAYCVHRADIGIRAGRRRSLIVGLCLGIALALVFLVLKYVEYSDVPYRWDSHAYGSIIWTIVGLHTAHVITLVLKTIVVAILAILGHFHQKRSIGVQVNGMYWVFVALIWLPLYGVLYIAPRVLQ